jgi:hypothetical protein
MPKMKRPDGSEDAVCHSCCWMISCRSPLNGQRRIKQRQQPVCAPHLLKLGSLVVLNDPSLFFSIRSMARRRMAVIAARPG